MTIENMANHRDDCMLVKPEELLQMVLSDIKKSGAKQIIVIVPSENKEVGELGVDYYKAGVMGLECVGLLELAKLKFVTDFGMSNDD